MRETKPRLVCSYHPDTTLDITTTSKNLSRQSSHCHNFHQVLGSAITGPDQIAVAAETLLGANQYVNWFEEILATEDSSSEMLEELEIERRKMDHGDSSLIFVDFLEELISRRWKTRTKKAESAKSKSVYDLARRSSLRKPASL